MSKIIDIEDVEAKADDYKRKMHIAFDQVKVYEKVIEKKNSEIDLLLDKLDNSEKDNLNVRKIMTDNLTRSNVEKQNLLVEVSKLREMVRGLKNGDNSGLAQQDN